MAFVDQGYILQEPRLVDRLQSCMNIQQLNDLYSTLRQSLSDYTKSVHKYAAALAYRCIHMLF